MNERTYMVELYLPGTKRWARSWSFGDNYTKEEAQKIEAEKSSTFFRFRATPLPGIAPTVARKPYRRHAAVTLLEWKGALATLNSIIESGICTGDHQTDDGWWKILDGARKKVRLGLELENHD